MKQIVIAHIFLCFTHLLYAQGNQMLDLLLQIESARNDQDIVYQTYINNATKALNAGNVAEGVKNLDAALKRAVTSGDSRLAAYTAYCLGNIHFVNKGYVESIRYYHQVQSNPQIKNDTILLYALTEISRAYREIKMYKKHHHYLDKAYKIISENKDTVSMRNLLFEKGVSYVSNNQLLDARNCFHRVIRMATDSYPLTFSCQIQLGHVSLGLKDFEDALTHYKGALHIAGLGDNPHSLNRVIARLYLGKAYLRNQNYITAITELKQAREEAHALMAGEGMVFSMTVKLGEAYEGLKQYKKALAYYQESLSMITQGIAGSEEEADLLKRISGAYKQLGQADISLSYLNRYVALSDSIHKQKQLQITNNQYKEGKGHAQKTVILEKSQAVVDEAEQNIRSLMYVIVLGGIGFLLLCVYLLNSRYKIQLAANRLLEKKNEEIERHNFELSSSNASLEQFAYVASHDMQEPLRMIGSYTSLMQRRYSKNLDSDANEFLDYIEDAVVRMNSLLKELLDFSRISNKKEMNIQEINMQKIIEVVCGTLAKRVEDRGARIHVGHMHSVEGNPVQLTQLFQNLISNAIKFAKNDTTPRIEISSIDSGDVVTFLVKDNGIGIDPDYHDRIFNIFQRLHTRDSYEGTGIGLAICKKIVDNHRGSIWVDSQPGKGSTFYISIPKTR